MSPDADIATDHWVLRAKEGQEYGPVAFEALRAWAAQNRFTAGYAISNNRRDWRTVESVPELGMDWFVEPTDGVRYGPFHPLALLDYVREGAIPPETRVIHKVNGGEAKAYQVLLEAFVDAIDQTSEAQGDLVRQIQALQERLEERDRWFDEENRQLQEERKKRQELEIEARRLEEQGALAAAAETRLKELEAELARARQEADAERRKIREVVPRLEAELRAARAEADQPGHARVQAELEVLKTDYAGLQQELKQSRDGVLRQRQEDELRLKGAESQAAEAAAAASRAEAELAVLKSRHERDLESREIDLKTRLTELEGERDRVVLESTEVQRELALERGRIWILEARLAAQGPRPVRAAGPIVEEPASGPAPDPGSTRPPPPRKAGSLAGLEAQAQAELKAWQDKKQSLPTVDPVPKNKSWIPWKKP